MKMVVLKMVRTVLFSVVATTVVYNAGAAWRAGRDEIENTPGWMVKTGMLPVDTNETECTEVPCDMTLFLLVGQSNMAGRGIVFGECRAAQAHVYKLNREDRWVRATTPIHFDRKSCGVGPAESFVKAFRKDNPERPVGLIPCSVGGSNSATWSPEPQNGCIGVNFHRAVARARKAMKHGRLAGILWHQGANDAERCERTPEYYPLRLVEIAAAFRRELGVPDVPFLIGELGGSPKGYWKVMNPLLSKAADGIGRSALVPAVDLTGFLPDQVHFDAPSYHVLGARYYAAWKAIVEGCAASYTPTWNVLEGRRLSEFLCADAGADVVAQVFSLSNGVLSANMSKALVLESPEKCGSGSFAFLAEMRYAGDGYFNGGLQFCVEDVKEGGKVSRRGIEYRMNTERSGNGFATAGIRMKRSTDEQWVAPDASGVSHMRRLKTPAWKPGVWHRVSVLKDGDRVSFFFDGRPVNTFIVEGAGAGRIGFRTIPCPKGQGALSFRNVKMFQL